MPTTYTYIHVHRHARLIDTVCARIIRAYTYDSTERRESETGVGTHSTQHPREDTAWRCKVLQRAR